MALQTKAQRGAEKERLRCVQILRHRRSEIALKIGVAALTSKERAIAYRFLAILEELEQKILGEMAPKENEIVASADFSTEEMEIAKKIIEDQDRNPFEV